MKRLILLSFVMWSVELSAQVVITQSQFPTAGTTIYRNVHNTPMEFDPGVPGPGNVWNYGGLNADTIITYSFIDPSTTPYTADFSNANLAIEVTQGFYAYFNVTNTIAEELGFAGDATALGAPISFDMMGKYNPPLTFMLFPSQLGTSFIDSSIILITLPGSVIQAPFDSVRVKRKTIRNSDFNAAGSLTVNSENWQNALRLHKTEVQIDSFFVKVGQMWMDASSIGFPPSTETQVNYEWYVNGQNFPVLVAYMNAIGDSATSLEFYATGTSKSKANQSVFSVYPNPASDFINISGNVSNVQEVVIYNTLGQKQNISYVIKNQQVEVALNELANGIYIYQVIGKNNKILSTGKFVVEK